MTDEKKPKEKKKMSLATKWRITLGLWIIYCLTWSQFAPKSPYDMWYWLGIIPGGIVYFIVNRRLRKQRQAEEEKMFESKVRKCAKCGKPLYEVFSDYHQECAPQ